MCAVGFCSRSRCNRDCVRAQLKRNALDRSGCHSCGLMMTSTRYVVVWFSLSVATSCATLESPGAPTRQPAESDAEIRCAAFETAAERFVPRRRGQPLALADSTDMGDPPSTVIERVVRSVPELDSSTVRDYFATNADRKTSCQRLPSGAPLIIVPDSVRRSLPRTREYWPAFYAAFPGATGLTRVSGIGLSTNRRQAMLVISHGCGFLCGSQVLVVLNRDGGGVWRIHYSIVLATA